MSFWPLPKILVERLHAGASRGPCVELGAGGGAFARRLRALGLRPILLDRRPMPSTTGARVQADLRRLPLRSRAVGLLILANTLRQVTPSEWPAAADEAACAARSRGCLVVLEDEPEARDEAEGCYRSALRLLDRAEPGRGRPLPAAVVERALVESWGAPVLSLVAENTERVLDPLAPLRWMRARRGIAESELEELEENVRRFGMSYGRFWVRAFEQGKR